VSSSSLNYSATYDRQPCAGYARSPPQRFFLVGIANRNYLPRRQQNSCFISCRGRGVQRLVSSCFPRSPRGHPVAEYSERAMATPSTEQIAFAFCAVSPLASSLLTSTWCGRRPIRPLLLFRHRPVSISAARVVCCELANPPDSDEESLDEAAMRAAEIHEVLQGLQDFKARIVDGKPEACDSFPRKHLHLRRISSCLTSWFHLLLQNVRFALRNRSYTDATKLAKKVRGELYCTCHVL
jgi:hypothetical protein